MSAEKPRGPWGQRNEEIDALRAKDEPAREGEKEFIQEKLKAIRQKIVDKAKEMKTAKFKSEFVEGIPGSVAMHEREGDISTLVEPANAIAREESESQDAKERAVEFHVSYSPAKKGMDAVLIVTGWTGR